MTLEAVDKETIINTNVKQSVASPPLIQRPEQAGVQFASLDWSNINHPWWPSNYRTGVWAFIIHRATGLALVAYLCLHLWVISLAALVWGGLTFDRLMAFFETPVIKALEMGLIALVLIHGLNGIRILLFDAGIGIRHQRLLFGIALGLAVVMVLGISVFTFAFLPTHK